MMFKFRKQWHRKSISSVIVCCNKGIGDVVLTLHLAPLLKHYCPGIKVFFLVNSHISALIEKYNHIDGAILWDEDTTYENLIRSIKRTKADAWIMTHLIDKKRDKILLKAAKKAEIPLRIGMMNRFFFWRTCNYLVYLSRSKNGLHEAQSNEMLLRPFGHWKINSINQIRELIHFTPKSSLLPNFIEELFKDNTKVNIILHPGSNGNGKEWPIYLMRRMLLLLKEKKVPVRILLTGSEEEYHLKGSELEVESLETVNLMGQLTLDKLITLIYRCDGLIASGTGPLHLAAALGIKTLGLFPATPFIGIKRWLPLGKKVDVLEPEGCKPDGYFNCFCKNECDCMSGIFPETVAEWIEELVAEKLINLESRALAQFHL